MKLLLALTAMFAFLAFCSWFSTPDGFLKAGDLFQAGISQAQDGEQHSAISEVLNPFPNERIQTNYNGQSVGISEVWYSGGFLQRYGENIWHSAYHYKPGLIAEVNEAENIVTYSTIYNQPTDLSAHLSAIEDYGMKQTVESRNLISENSNYIENSETMAPNRMRRWQEEILRSTWFSCSKPCFAQELT